MRCGEQREDRRYLIEKDAVGRCLLTIKCVEEADEGEYSARIDDQNVTTTTVYVGEPRFEFVVPLKTVRVNEREHACLECELNDKECAVQWLHDDQPITVRFIYVCFLQVLIQNISWVQPDKPL